MFVFGAEHLDGCDKGLNRVGPSWNIRIMASGYYTNISINSCGYVREVRELPGRYAGGDSTHGGRSPPEEAQRCWVML